MICDFFSDGLSALANHSIRSARPASDENIADEPELQRAIS
jgi:hypothetical protein